jgi:hypothetical protein
MKKGEKKKKSKSSEIKNNKAKSNKKTIYWVIVIVAVLAILFVILAFGSKKDNKIYMNNPPSSVEMINSISPLELVTNKEKYDMKKITLTQAFIPSTSYIYVKGSDGFEEKLFIKPKNTQYCMYFNLEGYLKKDTETSKDWVFVVDKFDCLKKS